MFRSTNEAVRFGLNANKGDLLRLNGLRKKYKDATYALLKKSSEAAINAAMFLSVQAQFCREAINADVLYPKYLEISNRERAKNGTQETS